MCAPAALAAAQFAITAATTIAQHEDQRRSAKAQEQMVQRGLAQEHAALQRQYAEIREVAMDDQQQRYRDFLIEDARLKVIGAESGLSGVTQDRIEQEARNVADTDMATIEANRRRQTEAAHTKGVSQSSQASVQLSGIRRPSALGAGLQIAGAAASSYQQYNPGAFRRKMTAEEAWADVWARSTPGR